MPVNPDVFLPLTKSDFYTIWDTFRSAYALTNLIHTKRYVDILRALVDIWRHDGFFPDGRSSNYNGRTQGGSNADNLFGDAWTKGLSNVSSINWNDAFSGMLTDAEGEHGRTRTARIAPS